MLCDTVYRLEKQLVDCYSPTPVDIIYSCVCVSILDFVLDLLQRILRLPYGEPNDRSLLTPTHKTFWSQAPLSKQTAHYGHLTNFSGPDVDESAFAFAVKEHGGTRLKPRQVTVDLVELSQTASAQAE